MKDLINYDLGFNINICLCKNYNVLQEYLVNYLEENKEKILEFRNGKTEILGRIYEGINKLLPQVKKIKIYRSNANDLDPVLNTYFYRSNFKRTIFIMLLQRVDAFLIENNQY